MHTISCHYYETEAPTSKMAIFVFAVNSALQSSSAIWIRAFKSNISRSYPVNSPKKRLFNIINSYNTEYDKPYNNKVLQELDNFLHKNEIKIKLSAIFWQQKNLQNYLKDLCKIISLELWNPANAQLTLLGQM